MYQALYRKWRPMTFSDVVGQRHVTETLRNQIDSGHLSHAYLFTGTRGTGKTTCAKILAKAANCQHPIHGEPCNECSSCVGINNGSIPDVSEIDAASYTGVDNIRAIRDETAYLPAEVHKRVFIIDECHMLSQGANNALLKTLEEPPEHVLFILATTELQKVPATILSRCQSFTFKRITQADISVRIREIAAVENIPLEPDGADLLARLAEGGLRDAISMLDQCASSVGGKIGVEEVLEVLGLAGTRETLHLAAQISARKPASALEAVERMTSNGKDVASQLNELLTLFRDMLILNLTADSQLLSGSYPLAELQTLQMGKQRLFSSINLIRDALSRMKGSQNRMVEAELCILCLCDESLSEGLADLLARVEKLEQAMASGKVLEPISKKMEPQSVPTVEPSPKTEKQVVRDAEPEGPAETKPKSAQGTFWPEVLAGVKARMDLSRYTHLVNLEPPTIKGNRLVLVSGSELSHKLLNKPEVLEMLEQEASAILGTPMKTELITAEKARQIAETRPEIEDDAIARLIERGKKFNNLTIE